MKGNRPDFSLAVAARALAASTVSYLEPASRGLTFSAYDAIVKDTLLPPFSCVVSVEQCGRDISIHDAIRNESSDGQALENDDQNTNDEKVIEMQKRLHGDYELLEKYERDGKQKVRCLIAVVHGRLRRKTGTKNSQVTGNVEAVKDMEYQYLPGSISITFRGTDTLKNVIADVKAITVPYDDPPFVPDGVVAQPTCLGNGSVKGRKRQGGARSMEWRATVHHGFWEAWYGDELRKTILQYTYEKMEELIRENQEAQSLGLMIVPSNVNNGLHNNHAVPTIDIVGHSLGGSIAVLAAFDLANTLSCLEMSNQAHIRVYTMGCPRVGNVPFAKLFNELVPDCWNVINDNDIVPAIPHSPSAVRSRLPVFCPCRDTGYMRHGRAVILKDDGKLFIDPSRRAKYRREAKVLRLKRAVDSHMTSNYRGHLRAAIQNEIDKGKQTRVEPKLSMMASQKNEGDNKRRHECKQERDWLALDKLLCQLEQVIVESRSDPTRSFHLLPGGT